MIVSFRFLSPGRLALALCGALLAACEPDWSGKVPVQRPSVAPAQADRPATVTVYSGDTVYSIARRYNISVRDLIEANGLEPPYLLTPGTVLRLSGAGSDYVVQKGDTLIGLARRFKVDFNTLAAVNGKTPPYVLRIGERLNVPGAGRKEGAPLVVASPNAQGGSAGTPAAGRESTAVPPAASGGGEPLPPPPPRETAYATLQSREAPSAAAPRAETTQPGSGATAAPTAPATAAPGSAAAPAAPVTTAPPPRGGSTFLWPVKGDVVAEFGPLPGKGQHNDGINIAAPRGTAVRAVENGVVVYVGNELKGFGNLLLVKHADGWMSAYAHNEQLKVQRGDKVRRGQVISTVGSSGNVTQPQLHFELRRGTEAVNPIEFLPERSAAGSPAGDAAFS